MYKIKELIEKCSEYLKNADLFNAVKCAEEALLLKIDKYGDGSEELMEDYGLAGLTCSLYAMRTAGNEQLGEERFIISDKHFSKSLFYYNEALEIAKLKYGEESMQTARIYTNMGSVYRFMEDDWQEEEYYMLAIGIYSELLDETIVKYGEESKQVAEIYENLSMIYKNMECTNEMMQYIEKAERIYDKIDEHKHIHKDGEECDCKHD